MTFEELLKSLGYTDEQISAITEGMKTNNLYLASEENLDIRYKKLQEDNNAIIKERDEGKTLIEQLQKSSKGNEDMQKQITDYQTKIQQLEEEKTQDKINFALKIALQNAKVTDTDYMAYKITEQLKKDGKSLELDETGNNIKGIETFIEDQKKANPTFFATETKKEVVTKELGKGDTGGNSEPNSLREALDQYYNPSSEI
mgnify:CR=1 FL=1